MHLDMFPQYFPSSMLVETPLKKAEITLPITEHKDNEYVLVASKCLSSFSAAVSTSNNVQNFITTV